MSFRSSVHLCVHLSIHPSVTHLPFIKCLFCAQVLCCLLTGMIRTLNIKSAFLTDCKVRNTILLTIGRVLYSRSLELIYFSLFTFYTHGLSTQHFSLAPAPENNCSVLCFYESILDISYKWSHVVCFPVIGLFHLV